MEGGVTMRYLYKTTSSPYAHVHEADGNLEVVYEIQNKITGIPDSMTSTNFTISASLVVAMW